MPMSVRTADERDGLGEAAFLKIDRCAGPAFLGALLLVNARGEPVEFTYSRIETPFSELWRADDLRRFATRQLAVALLSHCPRVPRVLLCLADEVDRDLFEREVEVSVPVCRMARAKHPASATAAPGHSMPPAASAEPFWISEAPAADSDVTRLLHELSSRGLTVEPFDRASRGLREVYEESPSAGKAP